MFLTVHVLHVTSTFLTLYVLLVCVFQFRKLSISVAFRQIINKISVVCFDKIGRPIFMLGSFNFEAMLMKHRTSTLVSPVGLIDVCQLDLQIIYTADSVSLKAFTGWGH